MASLVPTARVLARNLVTRSQVNVCVRALPQECWRCHTASLALGVVHAADHPSSAIRTAQGPELEYVRDLLVLAGSPLAATVKPRYSRSLRCSYTSSGCAHCDALFGAHFIHERVTEIQAAGAVETMPLVAYLSRPSLELILLESIAI